ncbi:MAG: nuclear transport factor 2 family protein [Flavobacterium sp.]|nr:nuclear transport factor 2 family protein [Flavobacterium sp.]
MTNKELIHKLYAEDGLRNKEFLSSLLDENFLLHWESSDGFYQMNKQAILDLADELKFNYKYSDIEISSIIEEENQVAVHYIHKVSTLENPTEMIPLAKFMVFWHFQDNKILKGYQFSKLG